MNDEAFEQVSRFCAKRYVDRYLVYGDPVVLEIVDVPEPECIVDSPRGARIRMSPSDRLDLDRRLDALVIRPRWA